MGQKMEKPSEKDEESLDNSVCSKQTGEMQQLETAEEVGRRDQDNGSSASAGISGISVSNLVTGQAKEHAVTSAHTDPQTGQPIRHLGQKEHPVNTRRECVGGDRGSSGVTRSAEKSKAILSPEETRQSLEIPIIRTRSSDKTAVAYSGAADMEEQGRGNKSQIGLDRLDPETQMRSLTASRDPSNEEDFVVLERDETRMSSDGENSITFGDRIKTEDLQSSIRNRVEEDGLTTYGDDTCTQPFGNTRPERSYDKSSPAACFKRETVQHSAEVERSRCRLQEFSHVGASPTETTGRGQVEGNVNDQSKEQESTYIETEHMSTQNNNRLVKRTIKSIDDLEMIVEEAGQLNVAEEPSEERGIRSNREPRVEKVDLSLHESTNQVNTRETQVDHYCQNRFAEVTTALGTTKEAGRVCRGDSHRPKTQTHSSDTPQLRDKPSMCLEQSDPTPCILLQVNEGCHEQFATLKKERGHVYYSAVITPPALTHLLPEIDSSGAIKRSISSQISPDDKCTPCVPLEESMPREQPKVKGPPPPVPKKPKNPFIKLKTNQLMSTDVQRRGKDYLRSEERERRRHTFDFNKILPNKTATNQDMCLLWDERGTYTVPSNMRPLSADCSQWEHFSLGHMDNKYGDMIDFDYCDRMEQISQDEEPEHLDMLQRRIFFERPSRYKSSPPTVAKKAPKPFASSETLHIPEVTSDNKIQRPKPLSKREINIDFLPERVSTHVSNDGHSDGREATYRSSDRDAGDGSEVGSYKPVAELIKETNQLQRHQGWVKPEAAKGQVRVAEESPSVKVSQMKNAFDVPKKSTERPQEPQPAPKKGTVNFLDTSMQSICMTRWLIKAFIPPKKQDSVMTISFFSMCIYHIIM